MMPKCYGSASYWKYHESRKCALLAARTSITESNVQKLVYLSLGSNLGNPEMELLRAIEYLGSLGTVCKVSSFYKTEPVERTAQPWFVNCAVELKTDKMPRQLVKAILKLEESMGRKRTQDKGPRNIDIDILLFNNSIVDTKELTIPHPAMHQRRFVLEPLAEIAPQLRHPVLKKTVRELLAALHAGQAVQKIANPIRRSKEE